MLPDQIEALAGAFREAAAAVVHARAGSLGDEAIAVPEVLFERPRQVAHGDLACNLAMQLARPLRANPRQLAEELAQRVRDRDAAEDGAGLIEALEIAGPGFINIRLSSQARLAVMPSGAKNRCSTNSSHGIPLVRAITSPATRYIRFW